MSENQYTRIFLDSGAYSANNSGNPINISEYIYFIQAHRDQFTVYANLDVIGNAEATWVNQEIMEKAGLNPLPVFHMEDPMKYLDRCLEYEYFALGGMAGASAKERDNFFNKCWDIICDKDGYPKSKVHGFGLASPEFVYKYPWFCMTEEDHEVLTKTGWKFRYELSVGEEILAFNKGKSLWEKILNIPTFSVKEENITVMYNRNFYSKTTSNHNWIVTDEKKNWNFVTTEKLNRSYHIPRIGEYQDFPTEKKYSDELVELMGWYWTDGKIKKPKRSKKYTIGISQSHWANPKKCERIKKIIEQSGEKSCFWKSGAGMSNWELYGEITKQLVEIAPVKEIPLSFILSLTKDQLRLFLNVSILGDGTKSGLKREEGFSIAVSREVKKRNLEILRIGCMLLGIPTSMPENEKGKALLSSSVKNIHCANLSSHEEKYSGNIWCLQVPSKSFFVRSKGKIYVTGNSIDSSSWVSYGRFGIIIIPKIKNGVYDFSVSPIKLFVTKESPKRSIDGVHYQNLTNTEKEWVHAYLEYCDCPFGDNENKGVSNDNFWRDLCNFLFFSSMCKFTKEYPWAWKRPNCNQTLFME